MIESKFLDWMIIINKTKSYYSILFVKKHFKRTPRMSFFVQSKL